MAERRKYPLMRLLLVGGLALSAGGTGWLGYRQLREKPTSPDDLRTPESMLLAAAQQQPLEQDAQAVGPPPEWQDAAPRGNVQRLQYQEPADNPAQAIPQPPMLETPADMPAANPYRGRAGGSFGAGDATPTEVPQPPLTPTEPAPANEPAPLSPPGNYYPENTPSSPPQGPPMPQSQPIQPPPNVPSFQPQPAVDPPPVATPLPPREPRPTFNDRPSGNEMRGAFGTPAAFAPTAVPAQETAAVPGDKKLEGPQVPAVVIEKFAPAEIQIGKQAAFKTHVRNAGQSPATRVVVHDQVPRGTTLVDTKPPAQVTQDGVITWDIGRLEPGADAALEMIVMPEAEGQIGSVAQVTTHAVASARTICTRPALVIDHVGPQQVLIGETVSLAVTLSNPGTGPATGVIIEEDVPEGLTHQAGKQLELEVGALKPGESRRMELTLTAAKPGVVENVITVRGEGNLRAEHRIRIEVVAPQLQVGVVGPKRRYLERQATYQLTLANPGTAAARAVDLAAFLPKGMKFVGADSEGQYDPSRHAVLWSLEELPPGKSGSVKLTTMPLEAGEQVLRAESRGARGLTAQSEQTVVVEAAAELLFSVVDTSDPIEIGADTSYEIRVVNNGTRAASNVRLAVQMPPELRALGGDGPSRAAGDEQRVLFEPLVRLQPREEAVFKVTAQATRAGDARIRVQLTSDEEPTPVTKEESTRVYQDR